MQVVIEKLHWVVFFYAIFLGYEMYSAHDENMLTLNARLPVIEQKLAVSKKKVTDLKKYFKDIEAAKRNIERVAQEVEKVQRRLPSDIADSENLKLIQEIAVNLNIREVFIKPETEIDKGFYFIKTASYLINFHFCKNYGLINHLLLILIIIFSKLI